MPQNLAVIIFSCLGLLFSVTLLRFLANRFLPAVRAWQLGLGAAALALGNIAPYLLRRPAVYEVAISSGICFAMLAAYLLAVGGLGHKVRPWCLAVGSLSVGLAAGSRPNLLFEGVLVVGVLAYLVWGRRPSRREAMTYGAVLLGPILFSVGLLFAYNAARFGSILQNGGPYVLAGIDQSKVPTASLSYLGPDLYCYLLAPVRWTLAFPYFALPPPPALPGVVPGGAPHEITGGLLTTTPIVLALGGVVPLLRRHNRPLGLVLLALTVPGLLGLLFLSVSFAGTTMRYEADFATFFLVPALVAWMALGRLRCGRLVTWLGTLAIVYGCAVGAAISITGFFDDLRTTDPTTYWALARLTSPLPTAVTFVEGHPEVVRILVPTETGYLYQGNSGTYAVEAHAFSLTGVPVELDVISPHGGQWKLGPTFRRATSARDRPVEIVVQVGRSARRVPLGNEPRGLPLSLRQGLNRVELTAVAPGAASQDALVSVSGVTVAPR